MSGIAQMRAIVLDCRDPKALAEFYSTLLGWQISYADDEWITIKDGDSVRVSFQLAPDHKPPTWPDPEQPQQFHLDVTVDDLAKAGEQVIALGAVKHPHQPDNEESFTVYLDPAGHPFCLCVDDGS
jgi:catechol-2,3-dioxygenase